MSEQWNGNQLVRFGPYEADLAAGELRKNGIRLKLQEQPFQVLWALLERPGEVVSREELRQRLWAGDTFVDFDNGLNTAIQKLRETLNDSARHPRYVETVPRRGYRWIGDAPTSPAAAEPAPQPPRRRSWWFAAAAALALGLLVAGTRLYRILRPSEGPRGSSEFIKPIPLTTYPGAEFSPSFSPDGNQVTFSWDGPGQDNFDIYVKLVGPGEPLRLTKDPARDSSPAWSPDGRFIAFVRWDGPSPRGDVMLIPALGGAERKVGTISFHPLTVFLPCLAWSADGKWLAVPDRTSAGEPLSLFLLSAETGEKKWLTAAEEGIDYYPAFSPDGRSLAFTRGGNVHVLGLSESLTPQGEPRPLATFNGVLSIIRPTWTTDGSELIFARMQRLYRVSARRGGKSQPRPILAGPATWPAISPRGNRLAFARPFADSNIWRLELAGGGGKSSPPSLLIASTAGEAAMDYSPDGQKIVFSSTRSGSQEIWVANSDGSNPVQVTFFRDFYVGTPKWSPDGERIAFDATQGAGDIFIISAEGGKPQRFTEHAAYDAVPSWSRDGKWIYFYSNRGGSDQIWKKPVEGGQSVQVTKNGGNQAFESPDGRIVYFVKRGAPGLWRMPAEGGEEEKFLDGVRFLWFGVKQEGVYFYDSKDPNQPETGSICVYSFATGQTRTIMDLNKPLATGLTVSPDGRWLLYSQVDQSGSDLMLVEDFQ